MIFKTFKQSLEDVYIAGRKINEINNLKLDATNITAYATALKGLNTKQAELVLSTQGLTVVQKQAVLSQAELLGTTGKLTTAELEAILVTKKRNKDQAEALLINTGLITSETAEATATNVVTAAKLKELVATGKLTQAEANLIAAKAGVTLANQKESTSLLAGIGAKIKGAGTALKGLGTGILTIAQAHPVIAGITAALALCGGAALANKIKQEKAAKAIKEAYEEAKNAIDEINNTYSTNTSQTKDIAKEYAELAQGVDLLTNANKSLSTEKHERFLELSNQLSKLYPPLTKSFDENGNAILDLSGDVDTIVGSLDDLIERQRVLANQEIVKQMPDLFAGYSNNVADLAKQKDEAQKTRDEIQKAYDVLNSWDGSTVWWSNGGQVAKGADNAVRSLSDYTNALDTLGIKYKQVAVDLDNDVYHNNDGYSIEADYKKYGTELHDIYVDRINKATDDVKYAEQQFEAETSSINQYLNTWLQTEFYYNQIEYGGLQKAIQDVLFNFDWSRLPERIDKNDWVAVSEYLRRNILFSINNIDDSKVSEALANIYTESLNSGELLDSITKVQEYFGAEHPISVSLQTKVDDIQPLINNVKDKLKGTKFDAKVGELSLGDLQIAAGLDVDDDTIQSWDELIERIEKVKGDAFNVDPTTLSTALTSSNDSLDKFQSSVKSAADAYTTLLTGNYSSSELLDSIQAINKATSDMGEAIDWESISTSGNPLQAIQDAIESVSRTYADSVLNDVGIDTDSKFGQMLANIVQEAYESEAALSSLNTQIDSLQSAYNNLTDIVATYNETGYISFDQLQTLLAMEPQYIACLMDESGQLQLNQESMLELANQRLDDAEAQAVQQAITELGTAAFQEEQTAVEDNAQAFSNAVDDLASYNEGLAETIVTTNIATSEIGKLNDAINGAESEGTTSDQIDTILDNLKTKLQLIQNTRKNLKETFSDFEKIMGKTSSGSSSSVSDVAKETKDFSEELNWVEKLINKVSTALDKLKDKVSNTYIGWSIRNNSLSKAMEKTNDEINVQQQAYEKYMQKAASVGLSQEYVNKIQNGSLDIEDITDEALNNQIKAYTEW